MTTCWNRTFCELSNPSLKFSSLKEKKTLKHFNFAETGYFETRKKSMKSLVQGFGSVEEGRSYFIKIEDQQRSSFGQNTMESMGEVGQELDLAYKNLSDSTVEFVAARETVASEMLQHIDSILENITIKKETEEEMEEAAREEKVLEREEDEMVVDERESDEMVGEADKSGAEDVHGEKSYLKKKAKYCRICMKMVINVGRHCRNIHQITYNQLTSKGKQKCPLCGQFVKFLKKHLKGAKHVLDGERVQELVRSLDGRRRENTAKSPEPTSPAFTWTACLRNFSAYLQTVDGGGKRADEAEKQKSILQRVVAHCNSSDLNAFSLDAHQAKHVKLLEESSCKPSTFIAHNAAIVAFIKL
ncbi:uncharacterized protein LOC143449321 isoform X1 [Clavelina lepadiformis]|uniref:uncharacterized protein LOC143449321 isoform X1 n=2 Tax=Clavelina lepadiformis TaxID=159417 RepID=UPI004042317E